MSGRHASISRSPTDPAELAPDVVRYYDEKTARIFAKYGPGPRVHFHSGLGAACPAPRTPHLELRAATVRAQEALLARLRPALRVGRGASLLDVGCGLGGGALYWADALGAHVTAITIVAEHARLAAAFASEAGVGDRVTALHRDAHDLRGLGPFDAAVAVESSCYLDRSVWFSELRRALRPGGEVHIMDCFLGVTAAAERFDTYWHTRIGALAEYEAAARGAGFARTFVEELNDEVTGFWALSRTWTDVALRRTPCEVERARLRTSFEEHGWLERALRMRDIRYLHVAFA